MWWSLCALAGGIALGIASPTLVIAEPGEEPGSAHLSASNKVFEWARTQGAFISDSLSYPYVFPETGEGMAARKTIGPESEDLFRIPLHACLHWQHLEDLDLRKLAGELKDEHYALVVTLLYELFLGAQSRFAIYLDSLNQDELVPLGRFWKSSILTELQDGLMIQHFVMHGFHMNTNFRRVKLLLKTLPPSFASFDDFVTRERFHWACAIVQSRSFMGESDINVLVPVADLLNHDAKDYTYWEIIQGEYVFYSRPGQVIARGEQVFNNYGGGEYNLHFLGEYGYVPFPNDLNVENVHMRLVNKEFLTERLAALGGKDTMQIHFHARQQEVMRFFRVASVLEPWRLPMKWAASDEIYSVQMEAAKSCVAAMQHMLKERETTAAEDYVLLHDMPRNVTGDDSHLRMAIQFRLDSKRVIHRNLYLCERLANQVLPCLPRVRGNWLARWRFYVASRNEKSKNIL